MKDKKGNLPHACSVAAMVEAMEAQTLQAAMTQILVEMDTAPHHQEEEDKATLPLKIEMVDP